MGGLLLPRSYTFLWSQDAAELVQTVRLDWSPVYVSCAGLVLLFCRVRFCYVCTT